MPQIETTVILTATIPAGLPANQKVTVNWQLDPALGTVTQLQVPQGEAWVLEEVYVTGSQDIDGILEVKRNLKDSVVRTPPVNSLLISNPSRPRIKPVVFKSGDLVTAEYQNLSAGGAATTSITLYGKLVRFTR